MRVAIVVGVAVVSVGAIALGLVVGLGGAPSAPHPADPGAGIEGRGAAETAAEPVGDRRTQVEERAEEPGTDAATDASVAGRVLDASSGVAIAGALVAVDAAPAEPGRPGTAATTDANGRYMVRFHRGAIDAWRTVRATEDGYLEVRRSIAARDFGAGGDALGIDLAMWPLSACALVEGRVVASDGSDVAQAGIVLGDRNDATRSPESGDPLRRETGLTAGGRFQVGPVPPGRYVLEVQCRGYERLLLSAVSLAPGSTTDVGTLVLQRRSADEPAEPAVLFGTVRDAAGRVAVGAVVVCEPGHVDARRVEVDESGAYELRVTPGDRRTIAIEIPEQPVFRFERAFRPGERVEYHHRAPGGEHFLGGVVVDGARPVPGLRVRCPLAHEGPPGAKRARITLSTETDAEGRFRLDRIGTESVTLVLEWYRGAYRDLVLEDLAVDRGDYRLRFPVPHGVVIEGSVRSLGGPVAGALIAPAFGPAAQLETARATSGPNGDFRVELPLTNQSVLALEVSHTGFRSASRRFLLREVEAGGSIAWDPVLFAESDLGVVAGQVTDAQGEPLAAVQCSFEQVNAPRHSRQSWTAVSDSAGRYESPALFPGELRVIFEHRDHVALREAIDVPRSDRVTLDVSMSRAVRGDRTIVFVDPGGRPPAGVEYSITCLDVRAHVTGTTATDGSVRLEDWPAARTSITLLGDPRHPQQAAEVVFAPGEAPVLRLAVRRGDGEVRGRVLSPDGFPVVSEIVVLRETGSGGLRVYDEQFTDQEGRFRFANLPEVEFGLDVANDSRTRRAVRPSGAEVTLTFPAR